MNRSLVLVFAGLLVLLQYPLWFGKGGWLRAWDLDRQVEAQQKTNEGLKRRNAGLESFFDEVIVKGFLVGDDAHGAALRGYGARMLECAILQD